MRKKNGCFIPKILISMDIGMPVVLTTCTASRSWVAIGWRIAVFHFKPAVSAQRNCTPRATHLQRKWRRNHQWLIPWKMNPQKLPPSPISPNGVKNKGMKYIRERAMSRMCNSRDDRHFSNMGWNVVLDRLLFLDAQHFKTPGCNAVEIRVPSRDVNYWSGGKHPIVPTFDPYLMLQPWKKTTIQK